MTTQIIYKGHNSPISVRITDYDGSIYTAAKMATITRAYLKYIYASGQTAEFLDSAAAGHEDVFDWATLAATGYMTIDGGLIDLTAGRDTTAELVVYDGTYTSGRVVTTLDILVTEDAEDTPAPTEPGNYTTLAPLTVTDDYQVVIADFSRPSIRVNAATLKTMTMPAMTSAYDGATLSFVILGAGDVKLLRNGTQTMVNGTHVSITGTQQYSSIKIEYVHAIKAWIVRETEGRWAGGA